MEAKDKIVRFVTFLLILMLGWILYRTLIVPKRLGVESMKKNLKNIDFQISTVLGEEVTLKGGAQEAEQIEEQLKQLILKIPSEKDIPKVLNKFLTEVGKGLNIDYTLIQPKKIETEGRYKRLPIELKFTATYPHFTSYLSQLKNLPEVMRIDSLDMRRSPANPNLLNVHLLISAFVIAGDVEKRAEAIAPEAYPKEVPEKSPFKPEPIPQPKKEEPAKKPSSKAEVAPAAEFEEPELNLQGILRGNLKAAIINDRVVYVDDLIEGYRLVNIKENSVVLKRGRKTRTLDLNE
jgi:Tfp pilus assembly protein PilO